LVSLRERTRPPRLKKTLLSLLRWGPTEKLQVWSVYRRLHRALKDLDSWERLAQELSPVPWLVLSTALKIAQGQMCVVRLRRLGPAPRVTPKALTQEYLALLRRELQVLKGAKAPLGSDRWCRGLPVLEQRWTVVCDASARPRSRGIGLVLRDPQQQIRAEVSRQVCAANALQAELEAAVWALQTVSAFGARHVQLCTDALSVVKAFEGVLAPRHSVHEALLQRMALALDSVEVLRVPRLVTRTADALAAQATTRSEPLKDTLNAKVLEFSRVLV